MLGVTQIKFIKDLLNLMVKNGKPTNKSAVTDKTERAYKILRDRIFSGYYLPRQRLVESALSEELGVNRFVIRDILKRFSVEKLVISEPYKGSVVAEVSLEEAFETYQVEAFLEGSAAFLATNRIKDEELKKLYGEKGEIAFGSQIRSYVLYPYQLVRDERTELKSSHTDRVLDGDIQEFIDSYLRFRAMKR